MKKQILKITLFALLAMSSIESKAFDTQFNWNNTSSCTSLTVKVYDAFNNLLYTTSTCCVTGVCLTTTNPPAYVTITDGTCSLTFTSNFNVGPQTCTSCGTCCLSSGGVPGPAVQYISSFNSGSLLCGPGSYQLTVTTL
jgi:hypothetical protein